MLSPIKRRRQVEYRQKDPQRYKAYDKAVRVKRKANKLCVLCGQPNDNLPKTVICTKCAIKMKVAKWKRNGIKGATYEKYVALQAFQNNCCALCRISQNPNKLLSLDHNHTTGEIRGLLCDSCNRWLGLLERFIEIPGRLESIMTYIKSTPILP